MERSFSASTSLVRKIFANYPNTFGAFCELINNSIQANAKNIWIDIDYVDDDTISPYIIKKIVIKDDGNGVFLDDVNDKLLNIGTENKQGGKGVGRFAALQLGQKVTIESVGYSIEKKEFSKILVPLRASDFRQSNIDTVKINTEECILKKGPTYYCVTIEDFYDSEWTKTHSHNRLSLKLLKQNIEESIFERYLLRIFKKEISIHINGRKIEASHYLLNDPVRKEVKYTDKKGKDHSIFISYSNVKCYNKIRVFITERIAGINEIISNFEFTAKWMRPEVGGWIVFVDSSTINSSIFKDNDMDELSDEYRSFTTFIKNNLTNFFVEKTKLCDEFFSKLKEDDFYPYKKIEASSESKKFVFDTVAYIVENNYELLKKDNKIRRLIYPLIDMCLSNGEDIDKVFESIISLPQKSIKQFHELLERTELKDVIDFSDKVSRKMEDLEFIDKLVYSDISKHVKERKELHKFLEKMLWIFGEEYSHAVNLFSDTNLQNNLKALRDKYMTYKADKAEDNVRQVPKGLKSITDLFLYSEIRPDQEHRKVLVIELKAPKVKLSPKEVAQVERYAYEIDSSSCVPSKVSFEVWLVGSDISSKASYKLTGKDKDEIQINSERVKIKVKKWSDILEDARRRLSYMSQLLRTRDIDVKEKAARDFAEIKFGKNSSSMRRVK